jgi:hypothetical protein
MLYFRGRGNVACTNGSGFNTGFDSYYRAGLFYRGGFGGSCAGLAAVNSSRTNGDPGSYHAGDTFAYLYQHTPSSFAHSNAHPFPFIYAYRSSAHPESNRSSCTQRYANSDAVTFPIATTRAGRPAHPNSPPS